MRPVLLLFLLLILAGCTASPGPKVTVRPTDWQTGPELLGFSSGYAHKGTYSVTLGANASQSVPAPASCRAYRGPDGHKNDLCAVSGMEANWRVVAKWSGVANGSSYGEPGFNVVVFDAAGHATAWWMGRFIPGASRTTQ